MSSKAAPMHIAGSQFGDQPHVCAFFYDSDEAYRVLLSFIKDGFDCRDRAFHVVHSNRCKEHFRRLESIGIDTAAAESGGQLKVYGWNDAHIDPHGHFDQFRMLELIENELKLGAMQGFGVGNMRSGRANRFGLLREKP